MNTTTYIRGYKLIPCTAIALGAGDTERQNAIYAVQKFAPGEEKFEFVIFGYKMPESKEDFAAILENSWSWDNDCGTLDTVILPEGYSRTDYY